MKWSRGFAGVVLGLAFGLAACGQADPQVEATGSGAPAPAARVAVASRYAGMSAEAAERWTATASPYAGLSADAAEHWAAE